MQITQNVTYICFNFVEMNLNKTVSGEQINIFFIAKARN